jgi:hypothetical protein
VQGIYKHASRQTGTGMTFPVFVPPHQDGVKLPVVWYRSGLTCTNANVTVDNRPMRIRVDSLSEYRRAWQVEPECRAGELAPHGQPIGKPANLAK